jgi:D-glycero-alpha-D-manno-heptose-7-phosphate kinase
MGGGTDLPDFYRQYKGKVLSMAINQYVYVVINKTPLINKLSARYSQSETVDHPKDFSHSRIREALLDLGIEKNIEIGSFASLPAKTGLGSSSSFSVALLKGLHTYLGNKLDAAEIARLACRLEIDLVGEPIGKQDQYAAAMGGMNVLTFHPDETVDVEPVLLSYTARHALEDHLLIFYTGITRNASSVLTEQKANTQNNFATLKELSDSVDICKEYIVNAEFKKLGELLHQSWVKKKQLSSNISNGLIDNLYGAGLEGGAWGGKVLGAGGGGCIMFIAAPDKKEDIRARIQEVARNNDLHDLCEIRPHLVYSGVETLYHLDKNIY